MKNILIVGSGGQIGTELVKKLRAKYGNEHVVASDLRQLTGEIAENGPFERIDSTQIMQIVDVVKKYNIDTFVMGDDWKGKFDFLKPYCDVVYLPRTPGISTTKIKEDLK